MIEYGIRESVKNGGTPTPQSVRDAIENMQDIQLFTSKVSMEPDTHNPHNKPLLIMAIKNSEWELVETFQPQD
jgi:branched-chain amino acid transport system substrate-binding protein